MTEEIVYVRETEGSALKIRRSAERAMMRVTPEGVTFPPDLTLDEARTLASYLMVPLPEDESTHNIEGIKFAVAAAAGLTAVLARRPGSRAHSGRSACSCWCCWRSATLT